MKYAIPDGAPTHAINYLFAFVPVDIPTSAKPFLQKGSVYLYLDAKKAKPFAVVYGLQVKLFESLRYAAAEFENCAAHERACNQ